LPAVSLDYKDFPDFAAGQKSVGFVRRPACVGPVAWKDWNAVQRDIDRLKEAVESSAPVEVFMTAASPGVVPIFMEDRYYGSEEAYVYALADVLKREYDAIHHAGFVLQLDCPDLATGRNNKYAGMTDREFLKVVELHVEALNHAVRDIPSDRMRLHVCWGNRAGPHHRDVPLRDIVGALLKARPAGLSIEGANPRHEHEWKVFQEVKLPEGKVLIPGVLDSTTNFIEHPEVVEQRIVRYAEVVGRENVIAGTDCGFGTMATLTPQVDPQIAWAKLRSMAEGARLATAVLW
jgi:5-methyltetrahydropteroyltriglutamate--homocysteine methyltransferase